MSLKKRKQFKLPYVSPLKKRYSKTPTLVQTKTKKKKHASSTSRLHQNNKYSSPYSAKRTKPRYTTYSYIYKSPHKTVRKSAHKSSHANLPNISSQKCKLSRKQQLQRPPVHEIVPEFDKNGTLTTSVVEGWLQTSQTQQLQSNIHSKFQSVTNFCKLKFAEINKLTYNKDKLHPSRIRVFASLLKLFIESISSLNPNHSFIKTILNDIYRSLFLHVSENDNKDLELSSFVNSKLYSEELTKLEDLILDPEIDINYLRKHVLHNQKQRSAKIIVVNNSNHVIDNADNDDNVDDDHNDNDNNIDEHKEKKQTRCIYTPTKHKEAQDEHSMDDDTSVDDEATAAQLKAAQAFFNRIGTSLMKTCFIQWQSYILRKMYYRKKMMQKFRAIKEKRWFLRWKKHVKEQAFQKTSHRLLNTRMELLKVRNKLEIKEKDYLRTIDRLKGQLNSILNREDDGNGTNPTVDGCLINKMNSKRDKEWNRVIAIHAMHILEYKKREFDEFYLIQ